MSKPTKLAAITLYTLALYSCANQSQRVALTETSKQHIKSNQVFVNQSQPGISKKPHMISHSEMPDPLAPMSDITSKHSQFSSDKGLIGNLLVKSLEGQVKPNHLNRQLSKSMRKFPWLKVNKHQARYNINEKEFAVTTKDHENTSLVIGTTYDLNSNFSQLKVSAYVKLVQMSIGNNEEVILYKNNFYVMNQLPNASGSNKNKNRWMHNNKALLKQKLRSSGAELARMITMDIQNPTNQVYKANSKQLGFIGFNGQKNTGHFIKKDKGYYVLSKASQELYAVNSSDLIK